MWPTITFSLCLLALSAALIAAHVRTWRTSAGLELDSHDRQFRLDQYRRRIVSSGMIGLVGIALMASPQMDDPIRTSFWVYWTGLLLAVLVIGLLAMFDLISTRTYFRRLQQAGLAEQAILTAQLKRLHSRRANGDHR